MISPGFTNASSASIKSALFHNMNHALSFCWHFSQVLYHPTVDKYPKHIQCYCRCPLNPSLLGIYTSGWFETGNNEDLSETLSLTKETLFLNATQRKGTGNTTDVTTQVKQTCFGNQMRPSRGYQLRSQNTDQQMLSNLRTYITSCFNSSCITIPSMSNYLTLICMYRNFKFVCVTWVTVQFMIYRRCISDSSQGLWKKYTCWKEYYMCNSPSTFVKSIWPFSLLFSCSSLIDTPWYIQVRYAM